MWHEGEGKPKTVIISTVSKACARRRGFPIWLWNSSGCRTKTGLCTEWPQHLHPSAADRTLGKSMCAAPSAHASVAPIFCRAADLICTRLGAKAVPLPQTIEW